MPISSPLRPKLRHASSGGEERGEPFDSQRESNPPPAMPIKSSASQFPPLFFMKERNEIHSRSRSRERKRERISFRSFITKRGGNWLTQLLMGMAGGGFDSRWESNGSPLSSPLDDAWRSFVRRGEKIGTNERAHPWLRFAEICISRCCNNFNIYSGTQGTKLCSERLWFVKTIRAFK